MPTDEAEAQMLGSADLDDMKSEWTLKRGPRPPTSGLALSAVSECQKELSLAKPPLPRLLPSVSLVSAP